MISVCIPIYNYNATQLIHSLSAQIAAAGADYELLIIDDASTFTFREQNALAAAPSTYIQLEENIGRSKIRNLFTKYAKNEYLLYLDGDSLIISKDFLANYIAAASFSKADVICGGRVYPERSPGRLQALSFIYGTQRESQSVQRRKTTPHPSFMTNNFLIKKVVLEQIGFDERLSRYGHEDTLFGYALQQKGIFVEHIENPVLNGDIETNISYLKKTEDAIKNLIQIKHYLNDDSNFINYVRLLKASERLRNYQLHAVIKLLFYITKSSVRFLLSQGLVYLPVFDFYKLGFLLTQETDKSIKA